MKKLENKIAVITGGSSGIGLATAKLFKEHGATVVIVGRSADKLQRAVSEIGENMFAISADISTLSGIESIVEKIESVYGKIDILFANAGISDAPELFDTDEVAFEKMMNANVKSVFFLFTKAFSILAQNASVIFTSSIAHKKGRPADPLYAATKAAVRSLGQTFAMNDEVLAKNIRVNVISPGAVATPLTKQETTEMQKAIDNYIIESVPMKRWGKAEEIAKVALFLASDDSSYITGGDIMVDGGWGQL